MQFDDGSDDVQPGAHLTMNGEDMGAATYDSDHDGHADSIIIGLPSDDTGGHGPETVILTDSNHDGTIDTTHFYNQEGQEIDPKTGEPLDGSTGTTGGDTGTTTETSTSTGTGPDITVDEGGKMVDVGHATMDSNNDGKPDTVVVKGTDGSVTAFTDKDGDGHADQITKITSDGKVEIATTDGQGNWTISETGHVDSTGKVVIDAGGTSTTGTGTGTTGTGTTGTDTTGTGTGTTGTGTTGTGTGTTGTSTGGDISVDEGGGKIVDVGKATVDINNDGKPDTAIVKGGDGSATAFTDADGDGKADSAIHVASDGKVEVLSDSGGTWHETATGHVDSSGKIVIDSSTTGTGTTGTGTGTGTGTDTTGTGTTGTGTGTTGTGTGTTGTDTTGTSTSTTGTGTTGTGTTGTGTTGTGTTGTSTGGDISVDEGGGKIVDVGKATVDINNDGKPDTAIVKGSDGSATAFTDADGDGKADSAIHVASDGKVEVLSDSGGTWHETATGHVDSSGKIVIDSSTTGTGTTGTGTTGTGTTGTSTTGTDTTDTGSTTSGAGGDITVLESDGHTADVGHATMDMDHDGKPDTAVVKNSDGSVTAYTDKDGDGHADQITQITASGHVVVADTDGQGHWTVVTTGQMTDGKFVPDSKSLEEGSPTGDLSYTAPDGQLYQLGAPTVDFDGDGTADTVVAHLADGTVVGYSDTDGDGHADQITQVHPDGHVVIGVPDGNGGWQEAAVGALDANGAFVASNA